MNAARLRTIERILLGFIPVGVMLIVAAWPITGAGPGLAGVAPFALLVTAWIALRAAAGTKGSGDAR